MCSTSSHLVKHTKLADKLGKPRPSLAGSRCVCTCAATRCIFIGAECRQCHNRREGSLLELPQTRGPLKCDEQSVFLTVKHSYSASADSSRSRWQNICLSSGSHSCLLHLIMSAQTKQVQF